MKLSTSILKFAQAKFEKFPALIRPTNIFLIFAFLSLQTVLAQTTYTWNGSVNTDWTTGANWTPTRTVAQPNDIIVFNNGAAFTVINVPTQTIRRISVQGNTNVTLQAAGTDILTVNGPANQNNILVDAGSTLQISNGTNALTLTFNTTANQQASFAGTLTLGGGGSFSSLIATNTVNIAGTLNIQSGAIFIATNTNTTVNGTLNQNGGNFTSTTANLNMGSAMVYNHTANGGQVPTATWSPTTQLNFTGIINGNITGLSGQNVGAITYNCPSQTGNVLWANTTGTLTVNGNLSIVSTGSGSLELFTTTGTLTVFGDMLIQGGTVDVNSAASNNTINVHGDLIVSAGATLTRTATTAIATIEFFGFDKNFNTSAGTFNDATFAITINAAAKTTFFQNFTITSGRTFTVNGWLDLRTHVISGAGTFTLANTAVATIATAHPDGINRSSINAGCIQNTGTRTLNTSASFIFKGTTAQVTGDWADANPVVWGTTNTSITIDNPAGVTLSKNINLSGANTALNLNNGRFILGNNNFNLVTATSSLNGIFSSSTMVVTNGTGALGKAFPTGASTFTFPLGDALGNYTPAIYNFSALGTASTIVLRVVNAISPNLFAPANYITRHWVGTCSANNPTHTLEATYGFVPGDVVGVTTGFVVNHFNQPIDYWNALPSVGGVNQVSATSTNANTTLPVNFQVTISDPTPTYYRTTASGNWNNVAIWQTSSDINFVNPAPVAATVIPDNANADGIFIQAGHTVNVSANQNADDLFVNGTLEINAGITLFILNGLAATDMTVNGNLRIDGALSLNASSFSEINGTVINLPNSGTLTSAATSLRFNASSTYDHQRNAGAVITASWDAASLCLISGVTTTAPTALNQTFGNFTWNCTGQTANLLTGAMNIQGNFTIQSTGAGSNNLAVVAGTASTTVNIGGDFIINNGNYHSKLGTSGTVTFNIGGNFILNGGQFTGSQASTGGSTLVIAGNAQLNAGTLDMSLASSSGGTRFDLAGLWNHSGSTVTATGSGGGLGTINFTGPSSEYNYSSGTLTNTRINYLVSANATASLNSALTVQTGRVMDISGILILNQNITAIGNTANTGVRVLAGGRLETNNRIVDGGGRFDLLAGGTIVVTSADGINSSPLTGTTGNVQTQALRAFIGTAGYIYAGSSSQVTGNGLPATISGTTGFLEINNSSHVTLTNALSITATGAQGLTMTSGRLILGNNNLTLAANTQLNGTFSSSTMIQTNGTGQLLKSFPVGALSFTFPIGEGANYTPVDFEFTANSNARNIGFRVVAGVHPNNGVEPDFIARYYVSTASTFAGTYSYNIKLNYIDPTDINGTIASSRLSRWNGTAWSAYNTNHGTGFLENVQALTNNNAPFAATTHFTARTAQLFYYRTIASGNWTTAANWEVDNTPTFTNAPVTAIVPPNNSNAAFAIIDAAHSITFNSAVTISDLFVDGTLICSGGSATLTPSGNIYMNNGSTYQHDRNGGAVISAIWDDASNCVITGVTNTMITNVNGQSFGNFEWNCAGQTATIAAGLFTANSTTNFKGDFTLTSTNGFQLNMVSAGTINVNVFGDIKVDAGTLNIKTSTTTVNIFAYGDLNIASGATLTQSSTNTATTINFAGINKSYNNAGTFNSIYINYIVRDTAIYTINSILELGAGRTLFINNGGTLIMNADVVMLSGTPEVRVNTGGILNARGNLIRGVSTPIGTFTLQANGTLITDHPDGINIPATGAVGTVRTATRTFTAGANYIFTANAQNTGTAFGSTNVLSVRFEGCDIALTVPATITSAGNAVMLDGAKVNLGNNNLTLNAVNATIQAVQPFSGSNMIVTNGTGQLIQAIPATVSLINPYIYPIGTGNSYTPVIFNITAAAARNIGARTIGAAHPDLGTQTSYLNRHWLFTNSSASGVFDYSVTLGYDDADVVGNEAELNGNVRQSGLWYGQTTALDIINNTFTIPQTGFLNHLTTGASLSNTEITAFNSPANPFLNFRTVASGNWSDISIWEMSTDISFVNPAPVPATYFPTATTARNIRIVNDHQVTLDVDVTVDDLFINDASTSSLTIPTGRTITLVTSTTNDLTLAGSVPRLIVDGTFVNQAGITGATVLNTFFNAGALHRHNRDGGLVPVATWDASATLLFDGFINTNPTALGAPAGGFGNIVVNSLTQTGNIILAFANGSIIKGDLNIESTGSGITSLANGTATINLNGNLNINGGHIAQSGFTGGTTIVTLALTGNFNQTGGTYSDRVGTGTGIQVLRFSGPTSQFIRTGGTFNNANLNYEVISGAVLTNNAAFTIENARLFTINAGGEMSLNADITANGTGSFRNNGRLNTNTFVIGGAGSFVQGTTAALALNAILSIGSSNGFNSVAASGNIQTSTRTINNPSNYIYESTVTNMGNGYTVAATQNTITFNGCTVIIPSALTAVSMTLNNANVTLGANVLLTSATTALSLSNSLLTLGNNNLSMNNVAHSIAGTFSNTNMIVTNGSGYLFRQIPATASLVNPYVFPVGSNGNYTPAVLNFAATATGSLGARTIGNIHPNMGSSSSYLERYWDFSIASGLASYTYSAELHYADDDIFNDENEILANQWDGSSWNAIPSTIDIADNILRFPSIGTLTHSALPLTGGDFTGRNTQIIYAYRTVNNGDWSNPATWEISTDPSFINPAPIPAFTYPTASNSSLIRIWNGNDVNGDVTVDVDQLEMVNTVNTKLTVASGVTMTVLDGPSNDFQILGTNVRLEVNGTLINQGQITGSTAVTTLFFDGSLYEHKQDGGLVPISTWETNATLLFSSLISTNITALGAPAGGFGNITYNCPLQTADLNLGLGTVTVKGNLNVASTGTGRLALYAAAGTLTINGSLNQTGGDLAMIGYTSGTAATTLQLVGNFNQTVGSYRSIHGTGTGVQAITFLAGPNRSFTQTGTLFDMQGLTNITVSSGAELTLNNGINLGTATALRTFTNSGTLWLGSQIIEGGANTSFVNTSAATVTLGVGHPQGIAVVADGNIGNIRTATTRTYGVLANYVYNGSAAQITGSGFTGATNLTIDNAAGVTQQNAGNTAQVVTVVGTLTLSSGNYQIGGASTAQLNTLNLNGAAISPLASTSLLSNQFSNLTFGPGTGNTNPDLYIPSSITNLNALTINIQGVNTVTQNSSISLHSSATGLTLTSGRLLLGNHNLTVLSEIPTGISGGSVTAMVVADGSGQLRRAVPGGIAAATNFAFPIGDLSGPSSIADYSPVTLSFTATSAIPANRIIGVRVTDAQHPDDGTVNDFISRFWTFTDSEAGNGTYTYNPTFTYSTIAPTDLTGTHAALRLNRWDGALWTQFNTSGSSPNLTYAVVQNELSAPIGGSEFTGRVNAAQPYVWQPTTGSHDFNDPLNWLPNRVSLQVTDVLQFTNTGTSTAINVPTQTVGQIVVGNNTNITLEALIGGARTLSIAGPSSNTNLTIAAGSTLQLGGTVQLTLNIITNASQTASISGNLIINDNGTLNNTFTTNTVATTLVTVNSGGAIINNGGIVTASAATLSFDNGSSYTHAMNAGAIPVATYAANSTVNVTGTTTTNPTWNAGPFGNIIWNCAGQTSATGALIAMTINGDMTVQAGTLFDNGAIITGNASGTFTVANGATYRTTRTAGNWFPLNYTNAVLQPSSTFEYAGTTGHAIPSAPTTNYGILSITGAVVKTLSSAISVQGISINTSGATLADGGLIITGPGVGSGTFSMVNGAIFATSNTNTNPMPVFQTYTFGATSVVNFNATSTNQNIRNIPAPGYGVVNVIANGGVKSLIGETFAQGNVTINANSTLDLNGNNLRLSGATPISVVASAVLTADAPGSTLTLEGTASQTLSISGTITGGVINQLVAANPIACVIGTTPTVFTFNDITVSAGALLNMNGRTINLIGLLTNNGEINGSAAASIFALIGSAPQNFNIGNYTSNTLGGLIVNNAAGATLTSPLNVTTLTLTNGLLTTTNTNLITVLGTAVGNVVGGSNASYVNGPIARTLPVNFTSTGTYNWPVGKADYQLFQLINPTTANAAGNVVIKVEVFDSPTGGTAGLGVSALLTDHRWEALITNNAANLTSAGRTALTENGLTNLVHHISRSATATGTYNLFGSTYTSPILTMNIAPDNLLGYYMIANNGGTISGPITVGTGGMVPSITNGGGLFDVINNSTVVGNVTASIISDLINETGSILLNEWTESPVASNFTVRIQPNAATPRLITNSANLATGLPLIQINGADRLTIDGQFSNDGNRWLTFRHTNTTAGNTGATIRLLNDAINNTIRNLVLENNNTNSGRGVVEFTTGNNSDNSVLNNEIRSSTGGTLGAYAVGVLSTSAGNLNLTISGNHFYQTESVAVAQTAISVGSTSSGHTISNNFIGGSAPNAGGAPWLNTGNVAFNGIVVPTGTIALNTINGNTIQNINFNGTGASSFTGINAGNGLFEITNNTIGNPSNPNAILVAGTGVTTGITVASTNTTAVTGNTIANLTASGTGTGVRVIGINTSAAGNYTIEQNTVRNLSSASTNAGVGVAGAIIGILNTATGAGTITVARNTVFGLNSTAAAAAVQVSGIVNSTGANGSTVTRNLVHSFSTASATARQTGILALNGLFYHNNMVRLGIDANGNSQTVPSTIVGIEKSSTNFITFYHNSVYIGGTNVDAGSNNTFAFLRSVAASSGNDNIRNNIFVNERSNAISGSNRHFAIVSNNTNNLVVDYNIYHSGNGTDAVFGSNNGGTTVRNGLPLWFIGNGPHSDANSGIGNPNFIAPTAATPNLRLNAATPAEGTGVLIAGITVDFDGNDRTSNTPVDIGAHAGLFNSILVPGTDIFSPVISFTPIPNQLGCSGPFTAPSLVATVTDIGVGVPTSGANVPRLWYRRSAPAPSAWASVPGTLISGNGNNGDWEFQVDYSLIPVTPTAGDVYQYYIAAQDLAVNNGNPNIGFSPFNANSEPVHTNNNVNTQLTAPVTPSVFVLSNPLNGTVYVGAGPGTPAYPTFNGSGGLFEAINQNGLDGNLEVIVQSTSITEPAGAPTQLDEINECAGGPFTVTIRPGSATDHVITGNVTGPGLISLNGADRIIIDGSIAGSGRWLTFVNTNTSSAVVHMENNAQNNQVRNTVLRATNVSTTSGIVHVAGATTAGTGNSNLVFHDNAIGGTGQSNNCILFSGSAIAPNANISITNNHIFNYGSASYSQGIANTGASGDNWTITGNSIYHTVNPSALLVAIYFPLVNGVPINNLNISNNFIGGNAPGAVGLVTNNFNSTESYGIFVNAGTTTISNNRIQNMLFSNTSNSAYVCINITGNTLATVSNNTFDEIQVLGNVGQQGYIFGIRSNTAGSLIATNNDIGYLACLGASTLGNGSYVRGIEHTGSGTFNISNNFFLGLQNTAISTGQSSFAIRVANNSLPGEVAGNSISNNTIYGPWILRVGTLNTGGYRNRGISVSGRFSGNISKNRIFDMYNESPVYGTIGIELLNNDVGTWTVSNNQIAFGEFTVVGAPDPNNHARGVKYGIEERMQAGSTLNLFYNTVHIEGAENAGSSSAAFFRLSGATAGTVNARNNIFINSRIGGTGLHNAITATGTAAASGWNSDYNLMASRNFNNVGNWLGLEYSFAGWQSNSGGDANSTTATSVLSGNSSPTSLRASELFLNKGSDLLLAGPGPADPFPHAFIAGLGTPVSILDDFLGAARSVVAPPSGPTMGVNEIIICSGTPPVANVISNNNNLCGDDNATLTLTGLGLSVGLTYQWFESTTSISGPWTPITGANSINYLASGVNQTTWYYADVTCTNSGITTSSNAFELTVIQNTLVATINGTNTVNVCSGTQVNLEASGAGTYSWSSNPIGFTSNIANPTASPLVTTSYTVTGNISGCNFSETVTAIVFTVTLSPISTTINTGDNVTITATPSGNTGLVEYLWTPCTNLDTYSGNTVVADPEGSKTYSVFAYDQAGCTATATSNVNVFDPSIIPPPPSTVSAGYVGSNNSNTYSSVAGLGGSTIIASGNIDDDNYTNISFPAGFNFQFVGNTYTSFGINSNGFIWFGSGTPAANASTPISTTGNLGGSGTIDGVISALGTDLWSKTVLISAPTTAQIVMHVSGTAPNRIVTIEWAGFTQKPLSRTSTFTFFGTQDMDRADFQIRLHENGGTNSNMVDFRYRNQSSWAIFNFMSNMQIGLRGNTNTDFVNRTASPGNWPSSAAGASNTSVCNMTDPLGFGTYINNNTTSFRFTPTSCVIVSSLTPSGPTDLCASASVDLTAAAGSSYTWYRNGVVITGATSQTLSSVNTDGFYVAVPIIGGCSAPSYVVEVKNHATASPAVAVASLPLMPLCNDNEATFNAAPTDGGCSPIYQWKKNGVNVGLPGSSYFDDNLVNGDEITVEMVSSEFCASPTTVSSTIFTVAIQLPGVWLGNGTNWDTPANWGCGLVPTVTSDVIIPTNPEMGNVFPEVSSNNISEVRNLGISTGASVTVLAGADLSVYGNFFNDGLASLGAGTVRMRANVTQNIAGSTITEFGNLTIDNSSAADPAVELDNEIHVAGNITFVQGKIDLNGNDIDLLGTGQLVNESNNHRVYGFPGEIKTVIDMAANTNYSNIGGMGVSINTGATAPGITNVERGHEQFTHAGSYQSIRRYFDISPTVNTGLDATLRIFYFDDEMQVDAGFPAHVKANLLPWRSTDNGVTWEGQFQPANLSNDIVSNWVQLTSIPAFSKWTLSDWIDNPLPVQLLSFDAVANYNNQTVDLRWITASEINNAFFTVERSANAQQFQPILTRPGAGNSNTVITYTDVDMNPLMGVSYYRLKQTDFDGTSTYSDIVPVLFNGQVAESVTAFVSDRTGINILYNSNASGPFVVRLIDSKGAMIGNYQFNANKGQNTFRIDGLNLATGIYMLNMTNGRTQFSNKLFMR